jgi:hypothetical protein
MEATQRRRDGVSARMLLAASLATLLRAAGGSVLVKGVTRNGLVAAGASKFFKLQLACPDTAESLQLSLTALEGNRTCTCPPACSSRGRTATPGAPPPRAATR